MACKRIQSDINPRELREVREYLQIKKEDELIENTENFGNNSKVVPQQNYGICAYLCDISQSILDFISYLPLEEREVLHKKNNDFLKKYIVPLPYLIGVHSNKIKDPNHPIFQTYEKYNKQQYIEYIQYILLFNNIDHKHERIPKLIASIYKNELIPICAYIYQLFQTNNNFADKINRLHNFNILN